MSRFKSNLYTVERRVWRNHKLCWIQNDDFTLFSGHHKTKIKEEDLPEWYVFGRYYKLWGFLSTKGITDLRYIPNLWINHFLKDDCLLISYSGKIEEHPDSIGFEKYSGVDERVWGNEILDVLKGARMFSEYDIAPILKPHGKDIVELDRSFEGIRTYLETHVIEGIVFWKDGQPWCKIKRTDFGLPWGR